MNEHNDLVLVTGANGFVGTAVVNCLELHQLRVRLVVRNESCLLKDLNREVFTVGDIDSNTNWVDALRGANVVIHVAAMTHIMQESDADSLNRFRQVNVQGTMALARQAVKAGVRRFIYISTLKVMGESTDGRTPFFYDEDCTPFDAYAISKFEAEKELQTLAKEFGMELVIIRPPLVYGPGAKGNFLQLMRLVQKRIPLPFGAVENCRSLVFVENLADFIFCCVIHPRAANQTFLISDGEDLSIRSLLQYVARGMNKTAILFPVPIWLLKLLARIFRKDAYFQKLCGALQVDIKHSCALLDWRPPVSAAVAVEKTAKAFAAENK